MLPSPLITHHFICISRFSGFGAVSGFLRVDYLPVSMVISQRYVSISAVAESLPVLFFSFSGYFF